MLFGWSYWTELGVIVVAVSAFATIGLGIAVWRANVSMARSNELQAEIASNQDARARPELHVDKVFPIDDERLIIDVRNSGWKDVAIREVVLRIPSQDKERGDTLLRISLHDDVGVDEGGLAEWIDSTKNFLVRAGDRRRFVGYHTGAFNDLADRRAFVVVFPVIGDSIPAPIGNLELKEDDFMQALNWNDLGSV